MKLKFHSLLRDNTINNFLHFESEENYFPRFIRIYLLFLQSLFVRTLTFI